ncbi:MAG: FtsX-like permease family protein [Acidobacteria bacterium]|nr:FtsX-like permease family protein [Acidobacteriota bacterium]
MRVATWCLARLVGTPAASAIAGDLAESGPADQWKLWAETWGIVLRLGTERVRGQRFERPSGASAGNRPPRKKPSSVGGALLGDVRFAFRVFRSHPVTTGVAVLSLALGIGANTAIFSLLDAIVLRPLPAPRPAELVTSRTVFSFPDYEDLAAASTDELTGLAAWSASSRPYSLASADGAWPVLTELATGNFFDVLELRPGAGRLLREDDDARNVPVGVISHRLWEVAFDSDPAIIGTDVRVNGVPITVVGVGPAGFRGTRLNRSVDLWVPLTLHEQLAPGSRARIRFDDRNSQWLRIMGRTRPGVSVERTEATMLASAQRMLALEPSPYLDDFVEVGSAADAALPRADEVHQFMNLLLAMVGIALLVACTNVANVLLTRTTERHQELSLRMALGAPRTRLIRQLVTESLLLSLMGGVAALLFARWTLGAVAGLQIPGRIVLGEVAPTLNTTTLVVTMLIALGCALLFGVGPALAGTRPAVARLSGGSTRIGRRWSAPSVLATIQVGLTLALVFGGGLFVRSLTTVLDVDLGLDPTGVYVSSLDVGVLGYDAEAAGVFRGEAVAQLESIPSIERAAWALFVPVQNGMRMDDFRVVGHEFTDADPGSVALNYVSPGFFETLGIRLRSGRSFAAGDRDGTQLVVVVNETFADHFWPGGTAVGERVLFPGRGGIVELEIVGVSADTKTRGLREEAAPYMYVPVDQWGWLIGADQLRLAWREAPDSVASVDTVRERLAELDPALPVPGIRSLDAQIFDQAMPQRVGAVLLGTFAGMALLLAAVGVYGVIAAAMASRVREIGIRRAVGAHGRDVGLLVLRRGLLPVLVGLPLGWFLAFLVSRLVAGFLPGLSPTDPATLVAATAVMFVVALIACVPSALQAARRDPALVLRTD